MDVLEHHNLVFDIGSHTIKCGTAGDDLPTNIYRSVYGYYKGNYDKGQIGNTSRDKMDSIISKGNVYSHKFDDLIQYGLDSLNVRETKEKTILFSQRGFKHENGYRRLGELFFEKHQFKAAHVRSAEVLSLYSSGRLTGAVCEFGERNTLIVPIDQGYLIHGGVTSFPIAGYDITKYLESLLLENNTFSPSKTNFEQIYKLKEEQIQLNNSENFRKTMSLPDGEIIEFSNDTLYNAGNILFNPVAVGHNVEGITQHIIKSIKSCNKYFQKILFKNIILTGGASLLNGFSDRLLKDLSEEIDYTTLNVITPYDRIPAAFIGGSIVGSLSTYKTVYVTKEAYEEEGPRLFLKQV